MQLMIRHDTIYFRALKAD